MFIFPGDSRGRKYQPHTQTQVAGIFQQLGQFRCCRRLKVPGFVEAGGILPRSKAGRISLGGRVLSMK